MAQRRGGEGDSALGAGATLTAPSPRAYGRAPLLSQAMSDDRNTGAFGGDEEADAALGRAATGDREAVGALLDAYRPRLRRMVGLRLDPRAKGRFDTSDVLQEAFIEASQRLDRYLDEPKAERMPFFLWVRFLVGQKLLQFHRTHLGAMARAADQEVQLAQPSGPEASTYSVASVWLAQSGTPSQAASADEEHARVREALDSMNEIDREVLVLRHFEQLSNVDVARVLGLSPQAASARYVRALTRIQAIVGE